MLFYVFLGEAGNRTCDPWFTRHSAYPLHHGGFSKNFFMAFLGINQFRRVGLRFVLVFITGTPKGSPKVVFKEKPGIEPATPGLQGIALIHYTTGASHQGASLKKLFVAFPWVETSTGPGGFMICVFIIWRELPKAQPKVVLWRSRDSNLRPLVYKKLFSGFPGYRPVPLGWFKIVCWFYVGNTQRLTESGFMEKPGIEPATPGLQGIALIHYTTGASKKTKFFVAFPWVETSTGPGGFMICVFIIWRELPKAQPKVVLWRSRDSNLRPLVYKKIFCGFPWVETSTAGRVYDLCVYYMMRAPEGSPKVVLCGFMFFMEKPGIKPATPGLQGITLIHYTTGASQKTFLWLSWV